MGLRMCTMVARKILPFLMLALIASPAAAAGGAQVPEASSMLLFALGAAGVMIGRRLSSRKED